MRRIKSKVEFEDLVNNSKKLVFAKFTASWCGPCKMMVPIIEEASKKFSGIEFVEIDVDDSDGLAEKYFISSVPTMIVFKNGEEFDKISGAVSYDKLESFLSSCL